MLAFLLALALFIFLTLLGKGVMEVLRFRFPILRGWLLAPSIGFAAVELLVQVFNQAGLPIKTFAVWLTLALTLAMSAVLFRRRPILPWAQLRIFGAIAVFSLAYTCWPMFLYGFRWAGYMNGDMGTYCLGALRAMNYGFYRVPALGELTGTDYSQYWWFHHAPGLFRSGADVFLAWFASLVHLQPLKVSMPVLGALSLCQLFAAASLILAQRFQRSLAATAACLVAASPFFLLGVVAQVLAQVGGLVFVFAVCTLCMRPFNSARPSPRFFADATLIAVLAAALCSYYPEVLPFPALAIAGYHIYMLVRRRESIKAVSALAIAAGALILLIARQSIFTAIGTLLFAMSAGIPKGGSTVPATDFDTMLDPSVFASIFGFQTYFGLHSDPWISAAILAGMALLLAAAIVCIQWCLKAQPAGFLLAVMLGMGVQLFSSYSAFGVFKLAMFIQPVLLAPLAALALRLPKALFYAAPAVFVAVTAATSLTYVIRSTSLRESTSVMLPKLQETEVRNIPVPAGGSILMDSVNMVGDFVFAAAATGTTVHWADIDVFRPFANLALIPEPILLLPPRLGLTRDLYTPALALRQELRARNATDTILGHSVTLVRDSRSAVTYLGYRPNDRWHSSNNDPAPQPANDGYFAFRRLNDVHDYLVLQSSDKGGPHFRAPGGNTSRWPAEADYYYPSRTMYAVGRHLLFEVINPTPNIRLRISLSRTLVGAGRTLLPPRAVIKEAGIQPLDFTGNGAANIITPPLRLFERNGRYYFALDFGVDGVYFNQLKTGIMRLFNVQTRADRRAIVALTRDIAIVPESQWNELQRSRSVRVWPTDLLKDPGLEFSGIYEDGWISGQAYMIVGRSDPGDKLVIRGSVPAIGKFKAEGNHIRVSVNGALISEREVKPGHFEIWHTFSESSRENRIEFSLAVADRLPSPDDRPIAAQLTQVSIINGRSMARTVSK